MNFLEAVQKLATDNPDCDYAQCRAAMETETRYHEGSMDLRRVRGKYQVAVDRAYALICDWLKGGHKADVILTWRSLAAFMYPRRPAIVWAVFVAMAREAEAEAKAGPVDVCLAGNPAVNGCCGEPDCVCAREPKC